VILEVVDVKEEFLLLVRLAREQYQQNLTPTLLPVPIATVGTEKNEDDIG
jgi:hypothetical protein